MNLSTHTGYPEGQKREDGTYTGRIYAQDGTVLEEKIDLANKSAYKKWVKTNAVNYERGSE